MNVLHWLSRRTCYTFPLALMSVFAGQVAAFYGYFYLYSHFHIQRGVEVQDVLPGNMEYIFLALLVLASVVHYILFGLLRVAGLRKELRRLRFMNDHMDGMQIRPGLSLEDLSRLLDGLSSLPLLNSLTSGLLSLGVVLSSLSIVVVSMRSTSHVGAGFTAGMIAILVYIYLTYIITDVLSTGQRAGVKKAIYHLGGRFQEVYQLSLRIKFLSFFVFLLITLGVFHSFTLELRSEAADRTLINLFTLMSILICSSLFSLYFLSIFRSIEHARFAAEELAAGRQGYIFSGSLDREFVRLNRSMIATAEEVNRYRSRMENLVQEKTLALEQSLEELNEREQRFRSMVENGSDIITITDPEGVTRYESPSIERILGYKPEELVGKGIFSFIHPDDVDRVRVMFATLGKTPGVALSVEYRFRHKDDSWRILESIGKNFIDATAVGGIVANTRDITERRQAQENLEAANQALAATNRQLEDAIEHARRMALEADASNRAKGEFLANMSHEIRTPLNAIIGMTGLLLDEDLETTQREYAETVRASGDTLLAIVNDILDFSKLEAGKMDLEIIDFDLRTCVEEVGDMMAARAQEKGLELAILIHYEVPTRVRGDPGRLRQVLLNLVNNAVKFTNEGEVLIGVNLDQIDASRQTVRFDIVDTGPGIPEAVQDRLFEPFSQVDPSTTRKHGGTGLGLAICRQLVEIMGGRVWVRSREGMGATFSFTAVFERQPEAAAVTERARRAEIRGLRILIVDDNATNRRVFREQLAAWGCETAEALDGAKALAMLNEAADAARPFQLAIVDFQMPGMDGRELARMIKSAPRIDSTSLILATSIPRRGDAAKMLDAGFAAYLIKPVKQSHLYDTIARLIGLRREEGTERKRELITRHTLREDARGQVKILVVEDNIVNQKVAVRMLERAGYRCDVAANGQEAVDALASIPYDLVLMDCQMPEMDGYEATRTIRKREGPAARRTPIIAMTAHAMAGDREKCMAAGMDDYLSKPVTASALQEILHRHLPPTEPPEDPTTEQA